MVKAKMNVKPKSVKVLLWGIVLLALISLLNNFEFIDFTSFNPSIITLIAVLFVATEIGVVSSMKSKGKGMDALQWFGTIVVVLAFVGLLATWFGFSIGFLDSFKGIIDMLLIVYVVIEIFR